MKIKRVAKKVRRAATAAKPQKKRRKKRRATHVAAAPKKRKPSGGRVMAKRKKGSSSKGGLPSWVKPTISMVVGGGIGLVAMGILPDAVAPYAPAAGVLAAKFVGGGGWQKYLVTAGVVAGVTLLSRRKTVQVAAGALKAAKTSLVGGGSAGASAGASASASGSAADRGKEILRRQGLSTVP